MDKEIRKKYRQIAKVRKKYNRRIGLLWFFAAILLGVFAFLIYTGIVSPEYENDGHYEILSVNTILKLAGSAIGVLAVALTASIITSYNNVLKNKQIDEIMPPHERKKLKGKVDVTIHDMTTQEEETPAQEALPAVLPKDDEDDSTAYALMRKQFLEQSDYKDVNEKFAAYLIENGLKISEDFAHDILSTLACCRVVFLSGLSYEGVKQFAKLMSGFFAGNVYFDQEIAGRTECALEETSALYRYMMQCKSNNALSFFVGKEGETAELVDYYRVFLPAMASPNAQNLIPVCYRGSTTGDEMEHSNNVWYFFPCEKREVLPQTLIQYGAVLHFNKDNYALLESNEEVLFGEKDVTMDAVDYSQEISGDDVEEPEDKLPEAFDIVDNQEAPVTFFRFDEIVKETQDDFFFSLDIWKKFDRLEAYLKKAQDTVFDNLLCRQIERFVAFEMCAGCDERTTLDKLLSNKLLPYFASFPMENYEKADERLHSLVDSLFGLQNLPLANAYIEKHFLSKE